jgi:enamine deaminase RidA (YjgF/YER057c/UK114 family)
MAGNLTTHLEELGIALPDAAVPVANYIPVARFGNLVLVAGQLPIENGQPQFVGKLGREFGVMDGQKAARLCAINIIAQVRTALDGDLDRVKRCLRIGGFVNSEPNFTQHSQVIDGASDLMVQVFGDAGKHARAAVGAASLPRGVAVEVEGMFEVA